ncbi:MAG: 4Fe-4S binding protein [Bacteroidia bacterium]|nr:4Fe-4S binding protein [Bacteroidia bacterium]
MTDNTKRKNWFKLFYQFAILALLLYMSIRLILDKVYAPDFEAYCPYGGLQALGSYITHDSLACAMTSMQIMMGGMLLIGVILFSKLFCGYICPLGTVGEWIGKLGSKLKIRFNIPRIPDLILRSLKYILLFLTFYFTLRSSELFCKKFDPYYAVATGFNSDVVVLWAAIALGALVIGSLFFRLFWCRYLCPLGALSNIFKFVWWFSGIILLYIILTIAGVKIPYPILLIVLAAAGYILEIIFTKKVRPSLFHISRNADTCTNCNLCSKKCPQGIDVAKMNKVTHVDCTLCGDCLYECPEKDTLQINRKNMKWFPAALLAVLIIIGLILGNVYELPTIDLKWGTKEQIADAGVFTMAGLKNVKCFGSSTAFANMMKKVKGIYGVSTYVGTHTVKVLYDKSIFDDKKLQEMIFVPEKRILSATGTSTGSMSLYTLTVDHFFDPLDATYLQNLLKQKTEACGYQSEFACPVIVRIYFPAGKETDKETLTKVIESKSLVYNVNGIELKVKLNYKVVTITGPEFIPAVEYSRAMYSAFTMKFNKYSEFTEDVISRYEIPMGENAQLRDRYSYIGSHLSNYKGIVGFETALDTTGIEMGRVFFVDTLSSGDKIFEALGADSLLLHFADGRTMKVLTPFDFSVKGEVR